MQRMVWAMSSLAGVCATVLASSAWATPAITADGLVLVVNKRQPAGRELAEHYAKVRNVPEGRIIEVDVPDLDEIAPEFYEKSIATVVRDEIGKRSLQEKTQCIVLFYGMPLRVGANAPTPMEKIEVTGVLDPAIAALRGQIKSSVEKAEALAKQADPSFAPKGTSDETQMLSLRGAAAETSLKQSIPKLDQMFGREVARQYNEARLMLTQMPALKGISKPTTAPTQEQVTAWSSKPNDPEARRQLRETILSTNNVFLMLQVVEAQKRALSSIENDASVDSELSCLFAKDYPRTRWVTNPWNYGVNDTALQKQVVRTARVDGPTPDIARRIIDHAVAVEAQGLSGDFVLDARGMRGKGERGSYDGYDQSIRNVAKYLSGAQKTIFDDTDRLLPDGSSQSAAVYSGWYSVRAYKPTATFVPGSIAWHTASYELVNLRSPAEQGWCRNLMLNGADVTIGPVAEPYLLAFPPADEFLGLLFTGKASVSEAYWASLPVTSWKMILIGDPLYRPFAKNPIIPPEQLPEALRRGLPD